MFLRVATCPEVGGQNKTNSKEILEISCVIMLCQGSVAPYQKNMFIKCY